VFKYKAFILSGNYRVTSRRFSAERVGGRLNRPRWSDERDDKKCLPMIVVEIMIP
jgi:hypothetical protein